MAGSESANNGDHEVLPLGVCFGDVGALEAMFRINDQVESTGGLVGDQVDVDEDGNYWMQKVEKGG